jgi:hypothetical protein
LSAVDWAGGVDLVAVSVDGDVVVKPQCSLTRL